MRQIIGAIFACVPVLGVSACGEASPPPAEGKAMVQNITTGANKTIGAGASNDFGGTVLDGTNGTRVRCSVKRSGSSFAVYGHIENAEMSLDVNSTDISQGAMMAFFIQGATVDGITSVDDNNNNAPTCVVNTAQPNTEYLVKPGSIYASFDCPKVRSASNLTNTSHLQGRFLFTGCEK